MRGLHRRPSRFQSFITVATSMLGLSVLTACGMQTSPPRQATTVVSNPPATASPTPNYKDLAVAHYTQTAEAMGTIAAATGIATWTENPYVLSPGPSATPMLGLEGCVNANPQWPYYRGCWTGYYNGHLYDVWSGRDGTAGDITQGLVSVHNRDAKTWQDIYTPDKFGAVQITSVDGTRFTLTTVNHQPTITYIFDLATMQWVSP